MYALAAGKPRTPQHARSDTAFACTRHPKCQVSRPIPLHTRRAFEPVTGICLRKAGIEGGEGGFKLVEWFVVCREQHFVTPQHHFPYRWQGGGKFPHCNRHLVGHSPAYPLVQFAKTISSHYSTVPASQWLTFR